jgi:serine/threonine protein kinase
MVVKCSSPNVHQDLAIKIIRNREVYRVSGEKELRLLQELNESDPYGTSDGRGIDKRHIVRLLESFTHLNHLCLVLEGFEQNLRESYAKLIRGTPPNLTVIRAYAQQLLQALYYLKKRGLVHADSKG